MRPQSSAIASSTGVMSIAKADSAPGRNVIARSGACERTQLLRPAARELLQARRLRSQWNGGF
jgi:hypothetical protein